MPHEADQLTVTLAVNCWAVLTCNVAVPGVTTTLAATVTSAIPVFPEPSVAVTTQCPVEFGAIYMPLTSMVPQEADQVTIVLAVNCCIAPSISVTEPGVMTTLLTTITFATPV